MRPPMEWDDAIRRQDAQEAYNDAWDDAHREQVLRADWERRYFGVSWPYGNAPLPAGHYRDTSLMPVLGPECCGQVRQREYCVCAGHWICAEHGTWSFGSHE